MLTLFRQENAHKLGLTLAFVSLLSNGSFNALAKGLTPYLSPLSLLLISEVLTACFVILTFGLVPLIKEFMRLNAKTIFICLGIGLLNSALAPLLWFKGLSLTTAVNASILAPAGLITSLLMGKWLLKEHVSRPQLLGALTIVAGIVVVNFTGINSVSVNRGDMMIFFAAQIFSLGTVLFKKYLTHMMPELTIVLRNFGGIAVVFLASVFLQDAFVISEVAAFPVRLVLMLLAFVFFARYLNLACFYEALDRLPATTVELIDIASPLSGMVFAVAILGETIGMAHVIGGLFIILGLLIEQTSAESIRNLKQKSAMFRLWHRQSPMGQMVLKVSKHA